MVEFLNLIQELRTISSQQEAEAREIADGQDEAETVSRLASSSVELCNRMKARTNEVFGDEDCCRKVFGDIVPSFPAFAEFFDKLAEIIKGFADERAAEQKKRISKYTAKYHKK